MPVAATVRGVESVDYVRWIGIRFRWRGLRDTMGTGRWVRATVHLERHRDGTVEAVGTVTRDDGTSEPIRFTVA